MGGSLENFILDRNFQSRSKFRFFFLIFGPSGMFRHRCFSLKSGVAPANQTKERSVHELFAGAFRNKSAMWIVLVLLRKKHLNSQRRVKFMNFSFWPFVWFGLLGRLLIKTLNKHVGTPSFAGTVGTENRNRLNRSMRELYNRNRTGATLSLASCRAGGSSAGRPLSLKAERHCSQQSPNLYRANGRGGFGSQTAADLPLVIPAESLKSRPWVLWQHRKKC